MDLRKIKKLMELLEESGISEIEVKEGEESIRLSRKSGLADTNSFAEPNFRPSQDTTQVSEQIIEKEKPAKETRKTINSPMVGTFYSAATPESKPFVETGKSVKKGETLCILEAMKMMNQVLAENDCKVIEILVDNAEPVEFDQPLFVIE